MECNTYLRNVQDLLSDGKTRYERRIGEPFKEPIIPFGSLVEYHPITAKDHSRIHQFGRKVLPGLFLGYVLYAGEIWKVDIMVADIEELETMGASEIYSKRLNAKEVKFHPKMENSYSNRRWTNQNSRRRSGIENIHLGTAEKVQEIFLDNQQGLHLHNLKTHFRMPVKQEMTFGPCQETSYTAITLNPESHFTRREKNHFPFPLKYIDVSITSHTNLDVMQVSRIDDY